MLIQPAKATSQKLIKPVIISQDIKDASNETLVAQLSHKAYEFCTVQDLTSPTLEVATDKLEQLMFEALNRIFTFNRIEDVPQFKVYEAIEQLFDDQAKYNCIKSISLLRRVKLLDGFDASNEKYAIWSRSRIRNASRVLCNKLEFITSATSVPQ